MSHNKSPLLVVAKSTRAIAEHLHYAGCSTLAIDLFADADTWHWVTDAIKVDDLSLPSVKTAVAGLTKKYSIQYCLFGSGFENYPDSLMFLHNTFDVLGISLDGWRTLADKRSFFEWLLLQQIPHPETRFSPPLDKQGWLQKPLNGEGGVNISFADEAKADGIHCYWQRHQTGDSFSLLFLALEGKTQPLGFQQQFVSDAHPDAPFLFSGLSWTEAQEGFDQVIDWAERLATDFPLAGLCSVDFIWHEKQCFFLEINPRLSASSQLYTEDIITAHIQCFLAKQLPKQRPRQQKRAVKIIYANKTIRIAHHFPWPEGCKDVPETPAFIKQGEPICSIIAPFDSDPFFLASVAGREKELMHLLTEGTK